MTSTLINATKNGNTLSESMQRMITPQYEQIVNEIENIYHHPDIGNFTLKIRVHSYAVFFQDLSLLPNGLVFQS